MITLETNGRKRKTVFEVFQKKREHAEERSKTRVFLGDSFQRWRDLKARHGIQTDALVAKFLLDSYEKMTGASSAEKPESAPSNPTSGPHSGHWEKLIGASSAEKPEPITSSLTSGPQSNHDEDPQSVSPPPEPEPVPVPEKSPSRGFALPQGCLQNIPHEERQPESIRVTPEREGTEGRTEEANRESDVLEGVDKQCRLKGNSEDWTQYYTLILTNEPTATEEGSTATERGPQKRKLCTECGVFYKKLPHECEHKTKPFVCNICGKRCFSEPALKIHDGVHSESYDHPCVHCHVNFRTRAEKLSHELIHQEQQDPYKCPDCALTFASFRKRSAHLNDHWDKYKFKCAVCGVTFRSKQRVLRHVVVHTGTRAFKCSECGCAFNQEGNLKSHMRLHTGERPYSCRHCDKSFKHNVSLKSHVQRYHPKEEEEEDISRETMETGTVRNEESKRPARSKNRHPRSGRPKVRPKRNAANKRKYSITMEDSNEESE